MASIPFTEDDLHELYTWVDEIPISRPKRNIARDFADGCSVAEILKFFFPKLVDLHNYVPAMSHAKKLDNWHTLNAKVLRKLYFEVPAEEVEDITAAVPGAIERFLRALRMKVAQIKERRDEMRMTGEMQGYEAVHYADPSPPPPPPPSQQPPQQQQRFSDRARDMATSAGTGSRASGRPSASSAPPGRAASSQGSASAGASAPPPPSTPPAADDVALLAHAAREKDHTIRELRETVAILSEKIVKLEELVRVKDEKLHQYRERFGRMPA
ncbi:Calponin-like domain protein [Novymonas esmeraldas]|uniref:Calponin-like domain protein n=1 Tax=Novymonas esmeraldas TaxID=1808958 RepID=A0AAW0F592_9TRYP